MCVCVCVCVADLCMMILADANIYFHHQEYRLNETDRKTERGGILNVNEVFAGKKFPSILSSPWTLDGNTGIEYIYVGDSIENRTR